MKTTGASGLWKAASSACWLLRPVAVCALATAGSGWFSPCPLREDLNIVPDGPPLTLAEAAEGKLVYSWPRPETYWVQDGKKRLIEDDAAVKERFGDHWRIKLIHLRLADLAEIPDGI